MIATSLVLSLLAQSDPTLPAPGTDMHFLSYRGEDDYVVTVGDQSCSTPCTLRLRPGPTKVHLVGPGEGDLQLVVPHLTAQVRVHTGPPGWYLTAGVIMIPGGIVIGASMWALGLACGYNNGGCLAVNVVAWPIIGVAMLITGSVLLGIYNRAAPLDANRPEILDAQNDAPLRLDRLALTFLRDGLSFRF